ncbi:hypothetical protein A2U01_0062881, partial [Trifolium medium]|nr:hypothetical protein [Trifolium medium]
VSMINIDVANYVIVPVEVETVVGDYVQADDAENDAAGDDVVVDSKDEDEDSGTSGSDSV